MEIVTNRCTNRIGSSPYATNISRYTCVFLNDTDARARVCVFTVPRGFSTRSCDDLYGNGERSRDSLRLEGRGFTVLRVRRPPRLWGEGRGKIEKKYKTNEFHSGVRSAATSTL